MAVAGYLCAFAAMNTAMIANITAVGIHSGANTQHHDQSIKLVSFSTIKAIANNPVKLVLIVMLLLLGKAIC